MPPYIPPFDQQVNGVAEQLGCYYHGRSQPMKMQPGLFVYLFLMRGGFRLRTAILIKYFLRWTPGGLFSNLCKFRQSVDDSLVGGAELYMNPRDNILGFCLWFLVFCCAPIIDSIERSRQCVGFARVR